MYTLSLPVSTLRTKMRQEFERHRYVNQLKTVDVLLFNSHQEFQVRPALRPRSPGVEGSGIDKGIGNAQLLEAAVARAQVLPCGGGAQGAVAEQLHQWFLGGRLCAGFGFCWAVCADCRRDAMLEGASWGMSKTCSTYETIPFLFRLAIAHSWAKCSRAEREI